MSEHNESRLYNSADDFELPKENQTWAMFKHLPYAEKCVFYKGYCQRNEYPPFLDKNAKSNFRKHVIHYQVNSAGHLWYKLRDEVGQG
jgi:hypothetical protein